MTLEEQQKAERLIVRLQEDDVQSSLKSGFQRDFSNSVIDQWERQQRLSARQLEILEDLVDQCDRGSRAPWGPRPSRRYEGF